MIGGEGKTLGGRGGWETVESGERGTRRRGQAGSGKIRAMLGRGGSATITLTGSAVKYI